MIRKCGCNSRVDTLHSTSNAPQCALAKVRENDIGRVAEGGGSAAGAYGACDRDLRGSVMQEG